MRRIIILLSLLLILLISIFLLVSHQRIKYPEGKDTVYSFGNGTYQILRNSDKTIMLINSDEQNCLIEEKIFKFKVIGNEIYIHGALGFTILNYKTNELKQYITFEGYPNRKFEQYNSYYKFFNEKYYGNKWIKLINYKDFTSKEKKILEMLK